ncbi:MAG: DUF5667 domain-containing protein [Nanoarchaeota archaeon]
MKKLIILSIICIFLLANIAYAQQTYVGSTPGDLFYGVKKAWEKIQLTFAKGEENKARLRIHFVDKRLLELEYIARNEHEKINLAITELQKETDELRKMQLSKSVKDVAVDFVETNSLDKLTEIKIRFETDGNKNNDNAIKGLENAIASHLMIKTNNTEHIGDFNDIQRDNVQIDIQTNGISTISAVINNKKIEYQIETSDSEIALQDLSSRTGISVDELKNKGQVSIRRK